MVLQGLYGKVHRRRKGEPISKRWAEALALIVFFVVFGVVVSTGLAEIEKNECRAWGERVRQNPLIQPANWQLNQCRAVGVPIKGIPVRR